MRNLKKTLKWAENKKIALAHFNVSNWEQLKAVFCTAFKFNVPVLIGVSEGERKYWGEEEIKSVINVINKKFGVKNDERAFWLFLNADHTRDINGVKLPAQLNFDEVMFDASKEPLEKNILLTRKAVEDIKKINSNVLVEGELGYIGESSVLWKKIPQGVSFFNVTDPLEAKRFVKETGVDLFAPYCGNIHGMYEYGKNPHLHIALIKKIKKEVKVPLVLHGGSGISNNDLRLAINAGISIIHVSTEIRKAWRDVLFSVLKDKEQIVPYKVGEKVVAKISQLIAKKIRLFYKL